MRQPRRAAQAAQGMPTLRSAFQAQPQPRPAPSAERFPPPANMRTPPRLRAGHCGAAAAARAVQVRDRCVDPPGLLASWLHGWPEKSWRLLLPALGACCRCPPCPALHTSKGTPALPCFAPVHPCQQDCWRRTAGLLSCAYRPALSQAAPAVTAPTNAGAAGGGPLARALRPGHCVQLPRQRCAADGGRRHPAGRLKLPFRSVVLGFFRAFRLAAVRR